MMDPRSCVGPDGHFIVGIHRPVFFVKNLRPGKYIEALGQLEDGTVIDNSVNFPTEDLSESNADIIYEIPNAFAFRGSSFINSAWADAKAKHPETIKLPTPEACSLIKNAQAATGLSPLPLKDKKALIDMLPHPLLVALAQASTDPEELTLMAEKACHLLFDKETGQPVGFRYTKKDQTPVPCIFDHELFEVIVNNPFLPDVYKNVMVLKPGVQGKNEITGEYVSCDKATHVFEYLRRNSYIPWGHFASNMANDAIRYSAKQLSSEDMTGIRHLYYQRAYVRMAQTLGLSLPDQRKSLTPDRLEVLRLKLSEKTDALSADAPTFDTTLWGWNFGFGYAQSGHRLHASHQMIHQQNAMIPKQIPTTSGDTIPSFASGDQVADFIEQYSAAFEKDFFKTYLEAIRTNTRTDGNTKGPASLIVAEGKSVLLFVPKAQICEFELQLMTKTETGNIFEADTHTRHELDTYILLAVKILESLGATMVTSIEYSKRFNRKNGQHLLYSFIPRLPYAPATFSEAQLRWINGIYPEDVAMACRAVAKDLT